MKLTEQIKSKLSYYANSVALFNITIQGSSFDVTDKSLSLQVDITREELNEYVKAVKENNVTEQLDAVCDVFVTSSWWTHIAKHSHKWCGCPYDSVPLVHKMFSRPYCVKEEDVEQWMLFAYEKYGQKKVDEYMEAVLESNMSKFIDKDDFKDREEFACFLSKEEKMAKKRYAGKQENVVVCCSPYKENIWMLRADNGKGKLLKHSLYKSPQQILGIEQ